MSYLPVPGQLKLVSDLAELMRASDQYETVRVEFNAVSGRYEVHARECAPFKSVSFELAIGQDDPCGYTEYKP